MVTEPAGWRSRIVGHGEERPDQLLANPFNWRIHPRLQQDAIEGTLNEIGWIQDIIVNRTTGHVIDGHARVAIAISRGEPSVPVVYVDLDENEERIALLSLDPLRNEAIADKAMMASVAKELFEINDLALKSFLQGMTDEEVLLSLEPLPAPPPPVPELNSQVYLTCPGCGEDFAINR